MSKRTRRNRKKARKTVVEAPTLGRSVLCLVASIGCFIVAILIRQSGWTVIWGGLIMATAYFLRLGSDRFIKKRFATLEITPSVEWGLMCLCGLVVFVAWFVSVPLINGQSVFHGF